MGKPYAREVERLQETYRATVDFCGSHSASQFAPILGNPLVAVGSGGSLTAAHLAVLLHTELTGRLARAMTPLETTATSLRFDGTSAIFLTAGGSNADIIGSYRHMMKAEPSASLIICARQKSHLAKLAAKYPSSELVEFELPWGKDGFLATNTLLATAIILIKGYMKAAGMAGGSEILPDTLERLLECEDGFGNWLSKLKHECLPIWARPTTVLLHGYWTQPAAVDLESKFTEASIGHLQVADYRHFAHGRHNWIGQRPDSCAVISLEMPQDRKIAEETLDLIPASVPRIRITMSRNGVPGSLEAIVHSLCLAQLAGESRSIDPGKPEVSAFGRTLYHLNVYRNGHARTTSPTNLRRVAVERKSGASVDRLTRLGTVEAWHRAYDGFVDRLGTTGLAGVVLDYDGTLIGCDDRESPISGELSSELVRLLDLGLTIGIATGRGDSVHASLRSVLPKRHAKSVLIGFHNGAIISPLSEKAPTAAIDRPSKELGGLLDKLKSNELLGLTARIKLGNGQITIYPQPGIPREQVWDALHAAIDDPSACRVNVWRSSHSIDITSVSVSKRLVVSHLRGLTPAMAAGGILCIGDMGKWPGNDYQLLREPLSLSVDEVSPDPNTCWRISPEGVRGVEATLWYLRQIEQSENKFVFNRR